MHIRQEQPKDYRASEELTREAFWNVYRPGCLEHYVLHNFRTQPQYIKELAFVMEDDEAHIVGHIMFAKASVALDDGSLLPVLTFGPLSIHPSLQRKGLRLRLLQHALAVAKEMGYGAVCMEGNYQFYRHAGFVLASSLGLHYHGEPRESEVPYFLATELIPNYLRKQEGTYAPPQPYFAAAEKATEFAEYEASFPYKEKLKLPTQLFE